MSSRDPVSEEKDRSDRKERKHKHRDRDREGKSKHRTTEAPIEELGGSHSRKDRDKDLERHPSRHSDSRKRERPDDRASSPRDRPRDSHRDKHRRASSSDRRRSAEPQAEATELNQREQDDIDKRAQRALAWQKLQADKQAAQATEAVKEAEEEAGWNLEDEAGFDDDEEEAEGQGQQPPAKPMAEPQAEEGAMDLEEGGDEIDPLDAFMADNEVKVAPSGAFLLSAAEEDEIDPLDAFMLGNNAAGAAQQQTVDFKSEEGVKPPGGPLNRTPLAGGPAVNGKVKKAPVRRGKRSMYDTSSSSEDEEEEEESDEEDDEAWASKVRAGKGSKGDRLGIVDHATINYPPFRKNFYIEVNELARMSEQEVSEYRKQLNGIKVRGKDPPKPIKNWNQCGLSGRVLDVIRKSGFDTPMPIQAQALPVIMSGRDCIGIAETGSGKTLAFVLPMLRHIKDQPPLQQGDGPIALVVAPTRELVQQISKDTKKFCKVHNMLVVAVYGGSGVANQITELKRGAEIVVCTPGRMIDILVTSGGKITNMRRVTYLVFDEADRMFDMGFEPQISRIHRNIRPSRQTVMFSATFPRSVETLARQALHDPVEIQVGGRSVVNKDITQLIEIRPEADRFLRLLEILGEFYENGKILIFVASQDLCDNLFRDLLKVGYPCLSLHGAKDQSDRESTINDFKTGVSNVLVATSIAARGLDVKDLVLVVNYETPNHHEDYVHRVGRTGRAGNKGTAITFISPEEDQYAGDLVKALKESKAPIPEDLLTMAKEHSEKVKRGEARAHGSGYGGSGFKFDSAEEDKEKDRRKATAKEYGTTYGATHEEEDDENDIRLETAADREALRSSDAFYNDNIPAPQLDKMDASARQKAEMAQKIAQELLKASNHRTGGPLHSMPALNTEQSNLVRAAQQKAAEIAVQAGMPGGAQGPLGMLRASQMVQQLLPGGHVPFMPQVEEEKKPQFITELEINDFPQHARWKITHRETIAQINELTGAAITIRGRFYDKGEKIPDDDRKLFLLIEGPTMAKVRAAKDECKSIIADMTEKSMRRDQGAQGPGKYNVM
ncbi:hypothetical protein ABBQ38_010937 [Trebouxia sp. C0009 RCD-2024]